MMEKIRSIRGQFLDDISLIHPRLIERFKSTLIVCVLWIVFVPPLAYLAGKTLEKRRWEPSFTDQSAASYGVRCVDDFESGHTNCYFISLFARHGHIY
jgi:hypothetical protein